MFRRSFTRVPLRLELLERRAMMAGDVSAQILGGIVAIQGDDSNDSLSVTQINAGRAYARVQLAATAHGVAMQPLQQALQEYPEQAQSYADIRRLLDAPQPASTVQMWARVGYAPPVDPAPRRGLDAQMARA